MMSSHPQPSFRIVDAMSKATSEPLENQSWLIVKVGGDTLGLAVEHVREVVRVVGLSRVSDAPFPVRGAIHVRGHSVPVVDLRRRMGMQELDILDSRVVLVEVRGRKIGLLVDAVDRLTSIDIHRIEPVPIDAKSEEASYLGGIYSDGEEMILLLDLDRVLTL